MNKYLEDPVLNLTATTLRVLRWFALTIMGLALFGSLVTVFAITVTSGEVIDFRSAKDAMIVFIPSGAVMFFLVARFLKLLREVVLSVGEGQPLTAINARRLRSMGWLSLGIQAVIVLTTMILAALGRTEMFDVDLIYDLIESVLIIGVLFILARVFDHGARMQEELEGTV